MSPLFVVSADVVGVARFEQCLESEGGGEEGVSEDESKGEGETVISSAYLFLMAALTFAADLLHAAHGRKNESTVRAVWCCCLDLGKDLGGCLNR